MTLVNHPQGYQVSWDNLLVNGLTLSGVSYSKRHLEMVKETGGYTAVKHFALAMLDAIPIIGAIAAIFERVIASKAKSSHQISSIPIPVPEEKEQRLSQEKTALRKQIETLKSTLFEAVEQLKTSRKDNERLLTAFNAQKNELKDARTQFKKLHNERSELNSSLDAMHQEIETCMEEN